MGKLYWAILIKRQLIGLAVAFVAGWLFDYLAYDPEVRSGLWAGVVAVILCIAASAILGLLNLIAGLIYLWLFGGGDAKDSVLIDLRAAKIPPPNDWQPRNFEYLTWLIDDEDAKVDDRIKAAILHGRFSAIMSRGLFVSLALQKAIDDAILRYAQEAPRK